MFNSFRAVLFRMVPKLLNIHTLSYACFRAVLFRMVPKRPLIQVSQTTSFRAVLFRMVPKHVQELKMNRLH